MIDVSLLVSPARDVIVLDLWEGDLPDLGDVRTLKVEPARWWLVDAGAQAEAIAKAVEGHGACTPIGGGLMCAVMDGPGWRDLLSVSGLLDTRERSLAVGAVARTVIHHVPVTIAVTGPTRCEIYSASSFAPALEALWLEAIRGR